MDYGAVFIEDKCSFYYVQFFMKAKLRLAKF